MVTANLRVAHNVRPINITNKFDYCQRMLFTNLQRLIATQKISCISREALWSTIPAVAQATVDLAARRRAANDEIAKSLHRRELGV